jgi:hypothetical protein
MTDGAWRVHRLLLGWAAVAIAAAAVLWLYRHASFSRFYLTGMIRIDRLTGELRAIDQTREGQLLMAAPDATPAPLLTDRGGILDDESPPTR